ncbi:MAG TPA: hypothetical protein PK530_05230 [Anaerolineales bacterium]|nr:hypothetical protein [Anaerolineales bacterium]
MLFRSLWLCTCSEDFEQSFYPENVDVLVSACECGDGQRATRAGLTVELPVVAIEACSVSPTIQEIPGGRLLFVEHYFIDLYTGERIPFTPPGRIEYWITEDLFRYEKNGDDYVFSIKQQVDIRSANIFIAKPDLLGDAGEINFVGLSDFLKQMKAIIVYKGITHNHAIAIDEDGGGAKVYFLYEDYFTQNQQGDLLAFLNTSTLPYEVFEPEERLPFPLYARIATSPSGQWYAKENEIYQTGTDQQVYDLGLVISPHLSPRFSTGGIIPLVPCCWRADESAVVLSRSQKPPTISPFLGIPLPPPVDGWIGLFFGVPQPILLVTLPEEVLKSTP